MMLLPGPGRKSAASALLRVAAGLVDERLEEREVLALLRVPEDAEGKAAGGILERLHRPVLRPRRCHEPLADPAVALVVVALDRGALPEEPGEARALLELDVVVGEDARRVLVLVVADELRQMLDEV